MHALSPQSIITAPGHCDDVICVCRSPIVKSDVGGHGGGQGFVRDINFGVRDTGGDDIWQTRWWGGVGHGGVFVFFYVSKLFLWMRGWGGGKI